MPSRFLLYLLLGLFLFYLQELVLFPRVYLRPLALLLIYVALRGSLVQAGGLAVAVGLLLDSYALTPFGIHLLGALVLVAVTRLLRQRFLLMSPWSLIPAVLLGLVLEELAIRGILGLLGPRGAFWENLFYYQGMEIAFTTLLAPVFFGLIRVLEEVWGRLFRPAPGAGASW